MKKTILLLAGVSLFAIKGNAQQWVSTTPENRKVVLEEFTGIHCGYCPDGHARANAMVANNPGNVMLVNIHAGGYAVPANSSEIDLRTGDGDKIDAASSLTGYPAGEINRVVWTSPMKAGGLAMDRGQWANAANAILAQPSPVNVAVKASVDPATRLLTVQTEVYYTDSTQKGTNYLTVMLLEDDILGTQTDYGNYNPTNWVTIDGKSYYRHNHVLRMTLSSTWGDKIFVGGKDYYEARTFTKTLPAMINNTELKFYNLHVVAFVTHDQNNILSGAETDVEFDPTVKTDLALTNLTAIPSDLCTTVIHPKAEVTNNFAADITGFDVTADVNGTKVTKTYTGTLKEGEKTTIDWGDVTLNGGGNYNVSIIGFTNINGKTLFDMDATNDQATLSGLAFKQNAMTTVSSSFDNGVMPANTGFDMSQNDKFGMVYSTSSPLGANSTNGAVRFALHQSWNVAGQPGSILTGELDVPADARFSYQYAYSDRGNGTVDGLYGGTAPQVKVDVSEDCGSHWTTLSTETCKETGKPAAAGQYYVPKSSEYIPVEVDLSAYSGKSILIKVSGIPGTTGNALYIDQFGMRTVTSIENNNIIANNVSVYPNPSNGSSYVEFSLNKQTPVSVEIFNLMGQKVQTVMANESMTTGNHKVDLNASNLAAGVYNVTLTTNEGVQTQPLQIVK